MLRGYFLHAVVMILPIGAACYDIGAGLLRLSPNPVPVLALTETMHITGRPMQPYLFETASTPDRDPGHRE